MSLENCGIITFSARKVPFRKVQTGKTSAEGSKSYLQPKISAKYHYFKCPSDSESLTSGSSHACPASDNLIILSTVFCMTDWFRLLLLYLGPRSLLASAATPWIYRRRHHWYQDHLAILKVFANVLKFLQPIWHSLLNLFDYSYGSFEALNCQMCLIYFKKTENVFSQYEWLHRFSWPCQVCGNNFKTSWDT